MYVAKACLVGVPAITQSVRDLKLPQVMREIIKALDCDKASVFILDEEKEQLVAEVAPGVSFVFQAILVLRGLASPMTKSLL